MKCNDSNCIPYEEFIKVSQLARAYVPVQKFCGVLDLNEGLLKGTVFKPLVSPYSKGDNLIMNDTSCNENNQNRFCNKNKKFFL